MEPQYVIIAIVIIGVLFLLYTQNNENMRPVVYITKGVENGQCGTAFVNMSPDHSEKERLFKTCPNGYHCDNNTCVEGELQGYEEYKWQEYDVT